VILKISYNKSIPLGRMLSSPATQVKGSESKRIKLEEQKKSRRRAEEEQKKSRRRAEEEQKKSRRRAEEEQKKSRRRAGLGSLETCI